MQLQHKTREWIPIESTGDNALSLERLEFLNSNNDNADHKVNYVPSIPSKPWS